MYSHQNVTLRGFHFEMASLTVNLAAEVTADHVGFALTPDASGPNKMKLAGAGDVVVARLATFEDRKVEGTRVGAAEFQFSNTLPIADGETINPGNTVVGAGGGKVKAAATADFTQNFVGEVIGTSAVVVKI